MPFLVYTLYDAILLYCISREQNLRKLRGKIFLNCTIILQFLKYAALNFVIIFFDRFKPFFKLTEYDIITASNVYP